MSRLPFPKVSESRSKALLDLLHTDISELMEIKTPGEKKYALIVIDDYSRFTYVFAGQEIQYKDCSKKLY